MVVAALMDSGARAEAYPGLRSQERELFEATAEETAGVDAGSAFREARE